jgi:hypothetical protein
MIAVKKTASIGLLILLVWTGLSLAQEAEKDKSYESAVADVLAAAAADSLIEKEGNTLFLPVVGYTPDTSVMLGAAVLRFFYLEHEEPNARPSVFSPTFIYTLNSQILVFLGTDLNWGEGKWHSRFGPSYIKFPDQFYGIGRDVSLEDEEDYTPERIAFKGLIERETLGELRLGLSYQILQHRVLEVQEDGILDSGDLRGSERSVISAPGVTLGIDTRDNTWYPSRGLMLRTSAHWARNGIGSDYDFDIFELDLRGYTSLGKKFILAGQYLTTSLKGDVPFYMLPQLGGDNGLRGYRGSLYRDQVAALGRIEIRRMEIWEQFGAVVFGGIGDVAPSPSKLTLARQLWTVGAGLRFAFDRTEKVNIRIDYGWGNGDSGFFLSLGEAF